MVKIVANIISKGTETNSDCKGYMALTEKIDNVRYIIPVSHEVSELLRLHSDSLMIKKNLPLNKIILSRFQLIPALFFSNNHIDVNSKILVCGIGCVGFATLVELSKRLFKKVSYCSSKTFNEFNFTKHDEQCGFLNYDVIIDCTGKEEMLEKIIKNCSERTTIVLLGTPRTDPKISLLDVHRRNLKILGGHELHGYSIKDRQTIFDEIVDWNSTNKNDYKKYVQYLDTGTAIKEAQFNNIYAIMLK